MGDQPCRDPPSLLVCAQNRVSLRYPHSDRSRSPQLALCGCNDPVLPICIPKLSNLFLFSRIVCLVRESLTAFPVTPFGSAFFLKPWSIQDSLRTWNDMRRLARLPRPTISPYSKTLPLRCFSSAPLTTNPPPRHAGFRKA